MKRSRGRPRQYDEDKVLAAAGQLFWNKGFSDTSLDELSDAMDMNRPSIYRAFGDKEAIYRRALMIFCRGMEAHFEQTMLADDDIRKRLINFFSGALEVYTTGERAKGCMVMSTAVTLAACHPEIQADLLSVIRGLDEKLAVQFRQAVDSGQIPPSMDADNRAVIAQSLLHSLSLRSRAGETPAQLERLIESGVEMITN